MGLEPLAADPRPVGDEGRRDVAERKGERGMFVAPRFQPGGHGRLGSAEVAEGAGGPPPQIDPSPQAAAEAADLGRPLRRHQRLRLGCHQLHEAGGDVDRFDRPGEVEAAGGGEQPPLDARPVEQIAVGAAPDGDGALGLGLEVDLDTAERRPGLEPEVIDQERAILDAHRHHRPIAGPAGEAGDVPHSLVMPHDMDNRPPDTDRADLRAAAGEVRERRPAGQPHLVDPHQLPPLLGHLRVGERDTAEDEPLPRDDARPLHLDDEIGELPRQPGLGADPHLLAEPVRPDGDGGDHGRDRDRHGPAHDRPERVGETVQGMGRRGLPAGTDGRERVGRGREGTRSGNPGSTAPHARFPRGPAGPNAPDSVNRAPLL